jgi:uncharacterized protein (DUF2164 family)
MGSLTIKLAPDRRARLTSRLQLLVSKEFDTTLSDFQAQQVIDLMLTTLGPEVYSQAVEDVRAHFQAKLDDLSGEVYVDGDL